MIQILSAKEIDLSRAMPPKATRAQEEAVAEIIANVMARGDVALREYTARFDGVQLTDIEVSAQEIDAAYAAISPEYMDILRTAKANIEAFHRAQLRPDIALQGQKGVRMGLRFLPLDSVGLYVPGGTASYPSTVLMNAVPAKLAGVQELIMVSPCNKEGRISNEILAAAKLAGVDRVFRIGGAQAVAALAYGTQSVPAVDKIVGPGNIYVATAKRQVFGRVAIDMIAGPSEILVIADDSANARIVAGDMLSQAEHDKLSTAMLITDSEVLARAVAQELEAQIQTLPRSEIARTSIDTNGKIVIADSIRQAVDMANVIAPEHLEIATIDAAEYLPYVRHAGSVFLGHYTPEALGDYMAGPNHTLPTGGTARFSSPLSVDDFMKKSSYIEYTAEALSDIADSIAVFAESEGLSAHARSVTNRFDK